MTGAPHHLSEHEIAASLLPGAPRPTCRVAGCTRCPAALDEAHGAAREFHDHVLPRTLPRIRARASERAPSRWQAWMRWWTAGPLAAAAAVAILFAVWPRQHSGAIAQLPDLRTKGDQDPEVRMFVRRAGEVHRLAPGGEVHPGDAIRFVVEPRGARYVLVVSIDGAGRLSVYHPFDGTVSAPLPSVTLPVELDGSVVLDDTLGDERIWVVLSDAPVTLDGLRPRLAELAAQGIYDGQHQPVDGMGPLSTHAWLPGLRAIPIFLRKTAGPGAGQ